MRFTGTTPTYGPTRGFQPRATRRLRNRSTRNARPVWWPPLQNVGNCAVICGWVAPRGQLLHYLPFPLHSLLFYVRMISRPSRLAAAALLGLLAAGTASAQDFSPAAPKRHYSAQGKAYFRGPARLTLGLGTGYYNGDLTSSVGDQFFGPAINLGFLYRFSPHISYGAEIGYVRVGAKDHIPERGLAFNTNAVAATALVRWSLLADRSAYAGVAAPARVRPFLQAGLGLALYSAQSYLGKTRTPVTTAILPAEVGSYPDVTAVFPVGAGLTIYCTEALNLSLEGNYYFTTTDTFDDNSKRVFTVDNVNFYPYVNRSTNDAFGTLMLKAEIKL